MRELILKLRRRGGNAQDELRSSGWSALDANGAAVRLHNLFHQVEPQTRSVYLVLYRAAAAKERVEDVRLFVGRDAGTVVGDANFHRRATRAIDARRKNSDP